MKVITMAYGNGHSDLGVNWLKHLPKEVFKNHNVVVHTDVNNVSKFDGYDCMVLDPPDKYFNVYKLKVILDWLKSGETVLFSDTDAIWNKDITTHIQQLLSSKYDMVFSTEAYPKAHPHNVAAVLGSTICTGLMAFSPTKQNIAFIEHCLSFTEFCSDQKCVNTTMFSSGTCVTEGDRTNGYTFNLISDLFTISAFMLPDCIVHRPDLFSTELTTIYPKCKEPDVFHPRIKTAAHAKRLFFETNNLWV